MIFLVPFLSSTGEMFVVCPKEQLQSAVGRPMEAPYLSPVPRPPKGSVLRGAFPSNLTRGYGYAGSAPHHIHSVLEDVAQEGGLA